MIPLIADPEQIDAEWLSSALEAAGVLNGPAVIAVERERVGEGLVGQNIRFTLTYDRDDVSAPRSVVGKFPSPEPVSRQTGVMQGNYVRETRFYQEIAPSVDIQTPRCFVADVDPATGDFVLLFEDLAPARPGDQVAGCSVEQARLALSELAGLHAPRWGDASLSSYDYLSRRSPEIGALIESMYQAVWPGFLAVYRDVLPPHGLELAERFGQSLAHWVGSFGSPDCVTHGDYRLDNMMFGTEEGGYPVAVVDWQTAGQGPAVPDAAYFLGAGLLPAERREHEETLLKEYHDSLIARGVRDYPWHRCWDDYRRGSLSGVLMSVVASMIVSTTERGIAMFSAMASRHVTHAIDMDAFEFL